MGIVRDLRKTVAEYLPPRVSFTRDYLIELARRDVTISIQDATKAFVKGFLPSSFVAYGLRDKDPMDFVPDLFYKKTAYMCGKQRILLDDKLLFASLISDLVDVPKTYCFISQGEVSPLCQDANLSSVSAIWEYGQECNASFILKPVYGAKGKGVVSLRIVGDVAELDGLHLSFPEFSDYVSNLDNYVLSEQIKQDHYVSRIFPGSVNTVRIVTMIDSSTREPFVAYAVQRIGTHKSAPTDNASRGGIFALVDLRTGILGRATSYVKHSKGTVVWYESHPDTGEQISGTQIPNWSGALKTILAAAHRLQNVPLVGWDVCVFPDRVVVIEGNVGPSLVLSQMHQPLLVDERVRKFFESYGIC